MSLAFAGTSISAAILGLYYLAKGHLHDGSHDIEFQIAATKSAVLFAIISALALAASYAVFIGGLK